MPITNVPPQGGEVVDLPLQDLQKPPEGSVVDLPQQYLQKPGLPAGPPVVPLPSPPKPTTAATVPASQVVAPPRPGPLQTAEKVGKEVLGVPVGFGKGALGFVTGTFGTLRDLGGEAITLVEAAFDPKARKTVSQQMESLRHIPDLVGELVRDPEMRNRVAAGIGVPTWQNIVKAAHEHPGEFVGNAAFQLATIVSPLKIAQLVRAGRGAQAAQAAGVLMDIVAMDRGTVVAQPGPYRTVGKMVAQGGTPDEVADRLATSLQATHYDRLVDSREFQRLLKEYKALSPADRATIHHFGENRNYPTPQHLQNVYYETIRPMLDEIEDHMNVLEHRKVPFDREDYIPRNAIWHALTVESAGSPTLSRSGKFMQGRTVHAIQNDAGDRFVVTVERGKKDVTVWQNGQRATNIQIGNNPPGIIGTWKLKGPRNAQVFVDDAGTAWHPFEATTLEIEKHTPIRYLKDPIRDVGATLVRIRQMRRSADLLEELKTQQGFRRYAEIVNPQMKGYTPPQFQTREWRGTSLPQFAGWKMEPKLAAVLDHYNNAFRRPDLLDKLNHLLVSSIFTIPFIHTPNQALNWAVAGGVSRLFHLGLSAKAFARAWNTAIRGGPDLDEFILRGFPAMRAREENRIFAEKLLAQAREEAGRNPQAASFLTRTVGKPIADILNLPRRAFQAGMRLSNAFTWKLDDLLRAHVVYELEEKGLDRASAVREANRAIADYSLPAYLKLPGGRVGEAAGIEIGQRVLNNRLLTMFNAYHTSLLRALRNMTLTPGVTHAEILRSMERLAALNIVYFGALPAVSALVRHVLTQRAAAQQRAAKTPGERIAAGDYMKRAERASLRPAGLAMPVDVLEQVTSGRMPLQHAISGIVTPSPVGRGLMQTFTGVDPYTGQPNQGLADVARGMFAPAQLGHELATGQYTLEQEALRRMGGVRMPKLLQSEANYQITWRDRARKVKAQADAMFRSGRPREIAPLYDRERTALRRDATNMIVDQIRTGLRPQMSAVQRARMIELAVNQMLPPYKPQKPGAVVKSEIRRNVLPGTVIPGITGPKHPRGGPVPTATPPSQGSVVDLPDGEVVDLPK